MTHTILFYKNYKKLVKNMQYLVYMNTVHTQYHLIVGPILQINVTDENHKLFLRSKMIC